ncbi:MAG: hypothetical protein JSR73_04265 [Proteobacteria bacterium]|nr:hypothetical protein [Pseudomonadota bacterium]
MGTRPRVPGRRAKATTATIAALAVLAGAYAPAAPAAGDPRDPRSGLAPDATLRLQEGRLSTAVDYMWGRGLLSFRAGQHNFSVAGAPMVAASVLSVTATGKVFNLSRLADFPGRYQRIEAVSSAGDGPDVVVMQNEHGVVLQLRLRAGGTTGTPGSGGVTIRLND